MDAPAYLRFRKTEFPNRITQHAAYSVFWDEYHYHKELQFKWVRAFELEIMEEQFKWIEVSSMADFANFLSATYSFVVWVAKFPGCREYCNFQ